ncbi:hypothetical protein C8R44DRAFT_825286 [Mycena epipterygia]|nr:hypothetical protein C8R44DRAFT_825286 [Mycena epipterygia]
MDATPNFASRPGDASKPLTDADLAHKLRSLERTNATHMLRELQLRLQYAKLKVDHGWQKQRLNEVENLYFRQQKQSDAEKFNAILDFPATALLTTSIDLQMSAPQPQADEAGPSSSLSFKASHVTSQSSIPMDMDTSGLEFLHDSPPDSPRVLPETGPSTQSFSPPRPHVDPWLQMHDSSLPPATASHGSFSPTPSPSKNKSFAPPAASLTYDSFWSSHSVSPLPDAYIGA